MIPATKRSILVVDDEVDTCQNLADILSDRDFEVDTASNGADALALVARKPYDVALLDLKMPGMDGLTLYQRMRKISPATVAIIVTAFANDHKTQEAISSGAHKVLTKPVDLPQLFTQLDEAIHQPLVLIIDDDEALCESLWDILRERRIRVSFAHSETEAIEALAGQDYQVVLVDLKLPGGDGRNVLSLLQRRHPEIHAVLVTGHPDEYEDVIEKALRHGADAVCYKPFDLNVLLETIERLIRNDEIAP